MKTVLPLTMAAALGWASQSPNDLPAHPPATDENLAALSALVAVDEAPAEPAVAPKRKGPVNGLTMSRLTTGSVQASTGVQSGARGLTPVDEWRLMFPLKNQGH